MQFPVVISWDHTVQNLIKVAIAPNNYVLEYMPMWDGDFTKLPSTESITRMIRYVKTQDPSLEGIGHFRKHPGHHQAPYKDTQC